MVTQVIEHLSVLDENYFVALDLLRSEFLDLDFIKSQIFAEMLSHEFKAEFDMDALRTFCTQMKANLWELKSSYGLNFMVRETTGEKLVSHIVFDKLPDFFKREMIRLSSINYPSISFLIEHFSECTWNKLVDRPKPTVCKANPPHCRNKTCLQNVNINSVPRCEVFKCNLSDSNAQFLSMCPRFPTEESKLKQCKVKKSRAVYVPTAGPYVLIKTRHLHLVFRLVRLVVTRNCCFLLSRSECRKMDINTC